MSAYKPGSRWKSAESETEIVVVRPPSTEGMLESGGAPMLPQSADRGPVGAVPEGSEPGALLGKRYADAESGLEVLCSKSGAGALSFTGRALALKEAKKLPSSD